MPASKLNLALANPCTVCRALDELPDDLAEQLDRHLADPHITITDIASALTSAGFPAHRKSVSRHVNGRCSLGLNYNALRAAA